MLKLNRLSFVFNRNHQEEVVDKRYTPSEIMNNPVQNHSDEPKTVYELIARGHAMADAEATAMRKRNVR